ncbi:MAG: nucleotidyltransferase domain-containing protein [Nanoarchaeota archaeon]|nr:nucleotidyltransferase domain-containing protein [Nanoarchaeota archaeon]
MVKETLNSKEIIIKIEEKSKDIKKYNVKKIGLFGSFAKNKQHKKSDIDIIVNFDKETFDNYMDLLFLLERMFKRKIDLVIEKDLHPELNYIKNEAKYVRL